MISQLGLRERVLASLAGALAFATAAFAQTFTINGTSFSYSDAQRSFTGIFVKPPGDGPFPAIIINHGQGGTPEGYSLSMANTFASWGLVCIGPELTHVTGGDYTPAGSGHNPENIARGLACLWALGTLSYVDMDRVAIWGHSKGSYASIGQAAAMTTAIRAAGLSAGGCTIGGTSGQAQPTDTEADPVTAPFILFNGEDAPADVALGENFEAVLASNSVPSAHHTFPGVGHNVHQDANALNFIFAEFEDWLTVHGVLGSGTTLLSVAADPGDGWVLESTETSGTGGSNSTTGGLQLGDDASDRQYRTILSFDTSSVPDGATIVSATLQLRRSTLTGNDNPFTTHGECRVDIRTGYFGASSAVGNDDFNAAATATNVVSGGMSAAAGGALSTGTLTTSGLNAINKTGLTQFRLYFSVDDNDDMSADYVNFYSANNSTPANKPTLIVEYQ
jgi:Dipeptidyl aminopeptidases/acylaminoacyl-peptidases